jgi:TonB family protein
MKHNQDKPHKNKRFLKIPSYPGGKEAFRTFIEENLQYPEEALKNLIEGTVYLQYTVDNIGTVADEIIIHGIGYGCDEEAMRLVRMLKYDPERNKGMRVKTQMKTRIRFELPAHLKPQPTVNFAYTPTATDKKKGEDQKPSPPETYGYTINLG